MTTTDTTPNMAQSLRLLADLFEAHPQLENWFGGLSLRTHRFGEDAADLDPFAEMFGIPIRHDLEPNKNNGVFYSEVEASVGCFRLMLQAHREDYEKATGKTIAAGTVEHAAEVTT